MAMTKKDYDEVARIILAVKQVPHDDSDWTAACLEIQNRLAYVFRRDNPRFDVVKFANACMDKKSTFQAGDMPEYKGG